MALITALYLNLIFDILSMYHSLNETNKWKQNDKCVSTCEGGEVNTTCICMFFLSNYKRFLTLATPHETFFFQMISQPVHNHGPLLHKQLYKVIELVISDHLRQLHFLSILA